MGTPAKARDGNRVPHAGKQVGIACSLSDAELRNAKQCFFLVQVRSYREIADGYAFRIAGEKRWLALVADLIIAKRECCPFLTFELTTEPKMGALTIRITGPEGTNEFLRSILAMPQP